MSLLKYKLLQAYTDTTDTWYPDDFKLNTKYFRVCIGASNFTGTYNKDKTLEIDFKSYDNCILADNRPHIVPTEDENLYYIVGTLDTYNTTETLPATYKWKKYTGKMTLDLQNGIFGGGVNDNGPVYVYFCRKPKFAINSGYRIPDVTHDYGYFYSTYMQVKSNINDIGIGIGTDSVRQFEIQGDLASLEVGDDPNQWNTCRTYDISFGGSTSLQIGSSNFRSAKDLIVNDINMVDSYPTFANCIGLEDAEITIRDNDLGLKKLSDYQIKTSKINIGKISFSYLFENTGVSSVTLNLVDDGGTETKDFLGNMFKDCKYLTTAKINCTSGDSDDVFSGNSFLAFDGIFGGSENLYAVDFNIPGQISRLDFNDIINTLAPSSTGDITGRSVQNKYIGVPQWVNTNYDRSDFISRLNDKSGLSTLGNNYLWIGTSDSITTSSMIYSRMIGQSGTERTIPVKVKSKNYNNLSIGPIKCRDGITLIGLRDILCKYLSCSNPMIINDELYVSYYDEPRLKVRLYSSNWGDYRQFKTTNSSLISALGGNFTNYDYIELYG